MKILYFISVHGHGRGGHFHSLNHISQKIGENHEIKIISFGPGKSEIIESNPHFVRHIHFKGLNFLKLRKTIKHETSIFNPDIYHCFDEGSYNIVRLIIPSNKNILVLNKCGGPNPRHFPYIKNLILFSLENQKWFKNQNKFKNTNIHLIPNRVQALLPNKEFRPIEKKTGEFVFVRICRITAFYRKSIQDAINLVDYFHSKNIQNIRLYIIGVVQDTSTFNDFKENHLVKSGHVKFFTDPAYTDEASKMLYLADAIIGTGRGLMEAASLSKPLLVINRNGEIPVLLNELNFDDAFKTNFSERNVFPKLNDNDNKESITRIISDKENYNANGSFVRQSFEKYFSLEKTKEAYQTAYNESRMSKRKLLFDSFLILRSIFSFYRSSQN